ncbi:MAG TPA: hypothetical protein VF042_09150 [Gemmatimonadaceae bacterium]
MMNDVGIRSGFTKRAFAGPGHYATPEDLARRKSRCFLDGMRFFIPRGTGCSVATDSQHVSSGYGFRGISTLQGLQPQTRGEGVRSALPARRATCVTVVVDGVQEAANISGDVQLEFLDRAEIAGVEYYSPGLAPRRGSCFSLVIWTVWYRGGPG